ncbi:MAG: hypothetical protein M1479_07925 [Actinobacteria bacterium]|nr:hypothetical protein [Actinomycetota bacterium]
MNTDKNLSIEDMASKNSSNRQLNIIPTPKEIEITSKNEIIFSREMEHNIYLISEHKGNLDFDLEKLEYSAIFLKEKSKEKFGLNFKIAYLNEIKLKERHIIDEIGNRDILIYLFNNRKENNYFNDFLKSSNLITPDSLSFFNNKKISGQSYILKIQDKFPIILLAVSEMGCQYACSTLLQLFRKNIVNSKNKSGDVFLPEVMIKDSPDYKYRGNNWDIWCELGCWSYDRGDGIEAYKKRIIKKLDMCLEYKVNFLLFDGLGWNNERFTGYGQMMRELNSEARKRGIYLAYAGNTSGYGASGQGLYNGEIFKNKTTYPDGKEYLCMGAYESNEINDFSDVTGSYLGTCISNEELTDLKIEELNDFVNSVEPGALYLHNLDVDDIIRSEKMWKIRCHSCRQKWPNDEVTAPDGMAGAFAHFYDRLVDGINCVNKDGYKASKDCLKILVSPAYSMYYHEDNEWNKIVKYWSMISNLMKNKNNVFFGIREQFLNHQKQTNRIIELKKSIDVKGKGHSISIIYFYGADGAYNNQIFLITPVLNQIFEGSDMLINASGNAYQEPLQLMNAEYSWNTKSSTFYKMKMPSSYKEFIKLYEKLKVARLRPSEIYGNGGFIEVACIKLYGEEVGKKMAQLFSLGTSKDESYIAFLFNWYLQDLNVDAMVPYKYPSSVSWGLEKDLIKLKKLVARFGRINRITGKAFEIISQIASEIKDSNYIDKYVKEDIAWYERSLHISNIYTILFNNYIRLNYDCLVFLGSKNRISDPSSSLIILKNRVIRLMGNLNKTEEYIKKQNYKPIDYLGGSQVMQREALYYLKSNLKDIEKSLEIGKVFISDHDYKNWW